MSIRYLLLTYLAIVVAISFWSYKKGNFLVWITLLFIPTIIIEQSFFLITAETIMMLAPVLSEFTDKRRQDVWLKFISDHIWAIVLFSLAALLILFFSEGVPVKRQIWPLINETVVLVFSFQTLMIALESPKSTNLLFRLICIAVIFNMAYCLFFEVILRVNPAGMPLYLLLGQGENEFIVDMIDTERGEFAFRAQTIYKHPLSLGQYLLVIFPVFLQKKEQSNRLLYISCIFCLVLLSGSRGCLFPLVLILIAAYFGKVSSFIKRLLLAILVLFVFFVAIPEKTANNIQKEISPYLAVLSFWDDKQQSEHNIKGSSMDLRYKQFDAALKEISDNPLFGKGFGYRDYYIAKHKALHPVLLGFESVFLLYLVERGWFGLLVYLTMIGYMLYIFLKNTTDKRAVTFIFIGFIISIILSGIRPLTMLFICLASTIVCGQTPARNRLNKYKITSIK